ncbi:MAG: VWA domain-containing protein [Planctomycetes bacterium]|nr:VWA domain-containing protein [Planctomycetota bacterium]
MKNQQAKSTLYARALSIALVPGFIACQSQGEQAPSVAETQVAAQTEVQTEAQTVSVPTVQIQTQAQSGVQLSQAGQLVQVGQTTGGQQSLAMGIPAPVAPGSVQFASSQPVSVAQPPQPAVAMGPVLPGAHAIDLAICLDTSGSMDGLIDSAKQTLWAIVNDMALVEPAPALRVALLTFGNDKHSAENGWVLMDSPLTTDLDLISQKLFALTTDGGTEYVGRVVDAATRDLDWSTDPNALKLIVVAGNESADQDPTIPFRDASKNAITAGIMVNSIYCGNPMDDIAPAWREVSLLADGNFASIDADNGMIVIDTPFDEELMALTASVNGTYIPWGEGGAAGCENQWVQDANNGSLNGNAIALRAQSKNSKLYVCSWDLVDATKNGQVKIEDVDRKFLAEELQGMNDEELAAHVEKMSQKRAEIQAQVTEVSAKREAWLAEERTKRNLDDSKALDRVMRDAIRSQAATKGIQFQDPAPAATVTE